MITDQSRRIEYHGLGDSIRVKPIADVHLGAAACDELAFKKYLADSDERTYFIGIGDLYDLIIVSDAKRYTKSNDTTQTDAIIDEQIDRGYELLKPYRERILGLGDGNHELSVLKHCSTHPTKRLCKALDVPHLGYSFLYRLVMSWDGGRIKTVIIRGIHGWGGGSRTQGADLTKFSRDVAYYDADLFLYGHVHRRQHDEVPRLGLVGGKLIAKPKIMVLCGTFLKTLSSNEGATYSEQKGYPPVSIGGACIEIRPTDDWVHMTVTL